MMQNLMRTLQGAFASDGQIDWNAAKTGALHIANKDDHGIGSGAKHDFDEAFSLAGLWLSEATTISDLATPRVRSRGDSGSKRRCRCGKNWPSLSQARSQTP